MSVVLSAKRSSLSSSSENEYVALASYETRKVYKFLLFFPDTFNVDKALRPLQGRDVSR